MRTLLQRCRLYGIVDMGYTRPEQVEERTRALIAGGVRIIQLRAKGVELPLVRELAVQMQALCREGGAIFVLNDYPEMAAEIGADAVHVGQDGGSLASVRAIVGDTMIVGRSTHSPAQAAAAHAEGADYIGFGPLFPTGTKPGRPSIGLQDIAAVQAAAGEMPVFCIGGINADTLPAVVAAGARRVVIVSWLLQQPDIAAAAQEVQRRLSDMNAKAGRDPMSAQENKEPLDALFGMMTVLKSLGLMLALPLMAWALLIMLMYGNMLVHYVMSERVYPAAAEHIDPALDGRLVRVCGPLVAAEKSLTFRENEEYPDALEVQEGFVGTASCHAEQLSVGKRKVQGLYAEDRYPFGYFLPSGKADGIEEIQGPTGRVYVLKSGAPVTLIGRQSGDTLDMSDPVSRADLGEISPRYAGHINNLNADFPIESVEGAALIAACVYALLWVLLGFMLRRRYLGWLLGMVGLLLMLLAACVL